MNKLVIIIIGIIKISLPIFGKRYKIRIKLFHFQFGILFIANYRNASLLVSEMILSA